MDAIEAVRSYKNLSKVEQAFRSMKTVDLLVRPIYHRTEDRVRAHIFLCMMAYYVLWHMKDAWRPLLFADENPTPQDDPVAPALRSAAALEKVYTRVLPDGTPVHSFATLLADLSTIVRNRCRRPGAEPDEPAFFVDTSPSGLQQRAMTLLDKITV